MIKITPEIVLDENDIRLEFIRASGPGGQKVNKVATAVQLRYNVEASSLPNDVRDRLARLAGKRMTTDGTLIIEAKRFRDQERNRQDALDRLVKLIGQAAQQPKSRRETKPTRTSTERRLKAKRRRGELKRRRRPISSSDE